MILVISLSAITGGLPVLMSSLCVCRYYCFDLPERDVEHHHHREADEEAGRREVAVAGGLRFRDRLLNDDEDHRSRGEGERVGQQRARDIDEQRAEEGEYRLDDCRELSVEK